MKVLLVHNRYQEKGGEDTVVLSEKQLLATNGVEVQYLEANNDAIVGFGAKLAAAGAALYSSGGVERLATAIDRFHPDVVHVHNWFPTLSPGVFWACKRKGVPVVHTLHNYRLLCVAGSFLRDEHVCEDCLGTTLRTPGIRHGCYRRSVAGSAVATVGMLANWKVGTWHRAVDRFIALTQFAKDKMISGGLPAEKLVIKPNFLDKDPGPLPGRGGYFAFVGRLAESKGIKLLLECWRQGPELPLLRIMGVGPLEDEVRAAAAACPNVEWLGARSGEEVLSIVGSAQALICPSIWYEGMPRVVVESLAVGTPVIAGRLGAFAEMIQPEFGSLIDALSARTLHLRLTELLGSGSLAGMRGAARAEYELRYSAPANFRILEEIYRGVIHQPASTLVLAGSRS